MISMETWGRGPGGDWAPAPSLAASAPSLRGGRSPGGTALNYRSRVPGRCCQESFVQFLWAECGSSLALHLAGLICELAAPGVVRVRSRVPRHRGATKLR